MYAVGVRVERKSVDCFGSSRSTMMMWVEKGWQTQLVTMKAAIVWCGLGLRLEWGLVGVMDEDWDWNGDWMG